MFSVELRDPCALRTKPYPLAMLRKVARVSGFVGPCQPSRVARPPSGPFWVHEIKHDGYRLIVHRDGSRISCFTRNGTGATASPASSWLRAVSTRRAL